MKYRVYLFGSLLFLISLFLFIPHTFATEVQIRGEIGASEESIPSVTVPESTGPTLAKPIQKQIQTTDLPKAGSVNGRMAEVGYGLLIILLLLIWNKRQRYKKEQD